MVFSPPFFGRMTTAMVISATAWTASVQIFGTAAALMTNAVLMVSNNRTGRDKSGHALRDAASLLTNAACFPTCGRADFHIRPDQSPERADVRMMQSPAKASRVAIVPPSTFVHPEV